MKKLRSFIQNNCFPILLNTAVLSSITYIYLHPHAMLILGFTVMAAVYSFALFFVFEFVKEKKKTWLSTLAVMGIGFLVFNFAPFLMGRRFGEVGIWFMEPSRFTQVFPGRTAGLMLMLGYILTAALYYFTRVRVRASFVFLICMCPFCLFAKTFTYIPVIYPIVITTLFFMIITGERVSFGDGTQTKGFYTAALSLVIPVTAIASFFPKLEFAPFRENFDEFISGVSISAGEGADFSDFSDTSSSMTSTDDTRIYDIYGSSPDFIRRQCFDLYNGDTDLWEYSYYSSDISTDWQAYTVFENVSELYAAAGYAGKEGTARRCYIGCADENDTVYALYISENMTGLNIQGFTGDIYRSAHDEYVLYERNGNYPRYYAMTRYDADIDTEFSVLFTDELAQSLSENNEAVKSYIRAKKQARENESYLLSEAARKECYSSYSAWERVNELAHSVTDAYGTVYEKAKALENYFKNGDFVYDLDFATDDPSPDNFIFSTKRGTCTAFASAMTLMCREIGLTARYAEGFLVQNYDASKGCRYVTTADSHAFTEVWIDGYGWTDFDPTTSFTDDGFGDLTFVIAGAAALFAAAAAIFMIYAIPRIKENAFRSRVKKLSGAQQAILIYGRINKKINEFEGRTANTYTPSETAEVCLKLTGEDISGLTEYYEHAAYGGRGGTEDNYSVYERFDNALGIAKKEKRRSSKGRKK